MFRKTADDAKVLLPASSPAVDGGKLVLEGRVRFESVQGPLQADYTLRMGVGVQRTAAPGVVRRDGRPALRSAVLWENPELKLWEGEGLLRMLPKLWVPVLSETGVQLPPCVDLQRASASDAAAGLVFSGVIDLDAPLLAERAGGGGGGGAGRGGGSEDGGGGGTGGKWTDAEREALRLPPSQ